MVAANKQGVEEETVVRVPVAAVLNPAEEGRIQEDTALCYY